MFIFSAKFLIQNLKTDISDNNRIVIDKTIQLFKKKKLSSDCFSLVKEWNFEFLYILSSQSLYIN